MPEDTKQGKSPEKMPPDFDVGAVTVGEFLDFIGPGLLIPSRPPRWPPDAFALAAALLQRTGAYLNAVDQEWPPEGQLNWATRVRGIGRRWRDVAAAQEALPQEVSDWWTIVKEHRDLPIRRVVRERKLWEALLQICAAADEASFGIGIPNPGRDPDDFEDRANKKLLKGEVSTLCDQVHPSRAIVLPKLHTPRSGMTMRSISHHLALYMPGEACPVWHWVPWASPDPPSLNLLLVPWPDTILPVHFKRSEGKQANMPPDFGYFTCDVRAGVESPVDLVNRAAEEARRICGRVDAVVLPELVLRGEEHAELCETTNAFVVGGWGESGQAGPCQNGVAMAVRLPNGPVVPWRQGKHHRWRLDARQVALYGLGAQLDPTMEWWEHIPLERREIAFWSRNPWLTLCVLICEDLARQDPIAEIVRSVGPNLVIALLLDGPQLPSRWSARYATVLAEDPGCSVLTLTCLGMVRLTRASRQPECRTIGLWKDARSGIPTQIDIENDATGVLICLSREFAKEWTADGRDDEGTTAYLTLSGIHQIRLASGDSGRA